MSEDNLSKMPDWKAEQWRQRYAEDNRWAQEQELLKKIRSGEYVVVPAEEQGEEVYRAFMALQRLPPSKLKYMQRIIEAFVAMDAEPT